MMFKLAIPFVTVASKGGPHDDDAYAAGWEMGCLHAQLRAITGQAAVGLVGARLEAVIRRSNAEQADLLAMDCGAVMSIMLWPDDIPEQAKAEWAPVVFSWDRNS